MMSVTKDTISGLQREILFSGGTGDQTWDSELLLKAQEIWIGADLESERFDLRVIRKYMAEGLFKKH